MHSVTRLLVYFAYLILICIYLFILFSPPTYSLIHLQTHSQPSDLSKPVLDIVVDDYPMITEFYNLQENTAQIFSQVPVDAPLFQPSPKVVVYENYAPFATHEYKLYFRNNDGVSRRIKVIQPESSFFQVSAPHASNGEQLRQSKIAPG